MESVSLLRSFAARAPKHVFSQAFVEAQIRRSDCQPGAPELICVFFCSVLENFNQRELQTYGSGMQIDEVQCLHWDVN